MDTKEYKARFHYDEHGNAVIESFHLTDTDLKKLRRFVAYYDEMILLGIDPSKMMVNLNVRIDMEQKRTSVSTTKPHPLVLSGFANAMRPFILEDEPTTFYRVLRIARQSCASEKFRDFTKALAALYKSRNAGVKFTLRAGQDLISQERAFSMWLNAYIYHRDHDKRELLESFSSAAPFAMPEALFQMIFIDKARSVQILALTFKHILRQDDTEPMKLYPKVVEVDEDTLGQGY